jgi:hypothetical protein
MAACDADELKKIVAAITAAITLQKPHLLSHQFIARLDFARIERYPFEPC